MTSIEKKKLEFETFLEQAKNVEEDIFIVIIHEATVFGKLYAFIYVTNAKLKEYQSTQDDTNTIKITMDVGKLDMKLYIQSKDTSLMYNGKTIKCNCTSQLTFITTEKEYLKDILKYVGKTRADERARKAYQEEYKHALKSVKEKFFNNKGKTIIHQ